MLADELGHQSDEHDQQANLYPHWPSPVGFLVCSDMVFNMIALLITLQLLDLLTTHLALQRGGFKEVNGLLAPLFDRFGVLPTLLVVKTTVIVCLLTVPIPFEILITLTAIYTIVVINNVRLLWKKKK